MAATNDRRASVKAKEKAKEKAKGTTGTRVAVAAKIRQYIDDFIPTAENTQRKGDAWLKTLGMGKYSVASMKAKEKANRKGRGDGDSEVAERKKRKVPVETPRPTAKPTAKKTTPTPTAKPTAKKTTPTPTKKNDKKPQVAKSLAQAKSLGLSTYIGKDGKKKAAVSAEELKASGHKSLRAYLNAKGKPAKKNKADSNRYGS